MVPFQIVLDKKIEEIENRKSQKSKKSDHIHHHHNKKIKNQVSIGIVIEIDKELMIGLDNVVTKEKEIKRKIKIEGIEIVRREEANKETEVEVKIMKKTERNKPNRSKSNNRLKKAKVKALVHKIKSH